MKFNSKTKEKTRLLNLIKYATQDKKYELEAIIQRGYNNKPISYIDFINIIRRVKNQHSIKEIPSYEVLNINFSPDSKYSNIRCAILGQNAIKKYTSSKRNNNFLCHPPAY